MSQVFWSPYSLVMRLQTGLHEPSRFRAIECSHLFKRPPPETAGRSDVLSALWNEVSGKMLGGSDSGNPNPTDTHSPLKRSLPLLAQKPHCLQQMLEHPFFETLFPQLSPPELFSGEYHYRWFWRLENTVISLTVKCIMNTGHHPSLQSGLPIPSHLRRRARAWTMAECSHNSTICDSLKEFIKALRRVFNPFSFDREKDHELNDLKQGTDTVMPSVSPTFKRRVDGMLRLFRTFLQDSDQKPKTSYRPLICLIWEPKLQ